MRPIIFCAVIALVGCTKHKLAVEPVKAEPGLNEQQVKRIVSDAVSKATAEVLQKLNAERQERDAAIRDAISRYGAAVQEHDALQQKAELARLASDEAKRRYNADILKAATATPEDQSRLREIHRKRTSGERLNGFDLEYASQFYEFQSLVESEPKRSDTSELFSGAKK